MNQTINHLRSYRKHTDITQYDIAMLLQLKGNTLVSRSEKGFRTPSLEMVVIYHLLFDTPLNALIANHIEVYKEQLLEGLPKLIEEIKRIDGSKNEQSRIDFLTGVIVRLSKTHHEK